MIVNFYKQLMGESIKEATLVCSKKYRMRTGYRYIREIL